MEGEEMGAARPFESVAHLMQHVEDFQHMRCRGAMRRRWRSGPDEAATPPAPSLAHHGRGCPAGTPIATPSGCGGASATAPACRAAIQACSSVMRAAAGGARLKLRGTGVEGGRHV
ncbi:hypothetical protein TSOC_009177 [Tetrabaena socialis]|uniref:Uncharacterized protein n=1 Tax=Tetrabaena socialis TaxID=47790 RepID=A0A2J7ZWJ3_9CHLO|nr:hypothetical protein TSOC_009177 [Tetrabaena socialis]|eukprot:PNH04636.1 hypothetical protein TSOC_009177 [Tetrabaena socialis]